MTSSCIGIFYTDSGVFFPFFVAALNLARLLGSGYQNSTCNVGGQIQFSAALSRITIFNKFY